MTMPVFQVKVGERWRHKPSGDVRTVLTIQEYAKRAGFEPNEVERAFGVTHIAVMGFDRRDSSDMRLFAGRPGGDWERVE